MRRFRDNFSFFIFRFSLLAIAAVMTGCGVSIKYSLSGASIPPDAKTFSVAYFPNNATMVSPILSSTDVYKRQELGLQAHSFPKE